MITIPIAAAVSSSTSAAPASAPLPNRRGAASGRRLGIPRAAGVDQRSFGCLGKRAFGCRRKCLLERRHELAGALPTRPRVLRQALQDDCVDRGGSPGERALGGVGLVLGLLQRLLGEARAAERARPR